MKSETGKPGDNSFLGNWWFFDTNCMSKLVKMWDAGQDVQVQRFVIGRDILITSSVVQELRKAPDILESLDLVFEDANLFLAPDMTRFWYADILNFQRHSSGVIENPLEIQPVPTGFFEMLLRRSEFEEACREAETDVEDRFFDVIELDIGSNLDERDLCIFIFDVVNRHSQEWFRIGVRPQDCTPTNFPSFYNFYYAYYFRYVKNEVKPELNDFLDLANCLPLHYCERFYGERKFTTILRDYVQKRKPPTAFRLAKRLYRKGSLDESQFQVIKRNKSMFSRTSPLLPGVRIFNFTEMCEQIQDIAS